MNVPTPPKPEPGRRTLAYHLYDAQPGYLGLTWFTTEGRHSVTVRYTGPARDLAEDGAVVVDRHPAAGGWHLGPYPDVARERYDAVRAELSAAYAEHRTTAG
ncbi:hypothetical protein [Kitasatospora sp. McL0602]|uniref:hypothetical protein n=1 Tax=Kitasatospora sp. McL0602 TaxID=3439530 RepID=UPI003F89E38A